MLQSLRARSTSLQPLPAAPRTVARGREGIWDDLRRPDFADTMRRICTLCGWTGASPTGGGQSMAITSAAEREGKSSIARAIAIAMAHDHTDDVLLLECDLLRPSLAEDFGFDPEPGLSDVLDGGVTLTAAVRRSGLSNLWLLPAGAASPNPSRLLRSPAMKAALDETARHFAYVVLDLPAVLKSSDAAVLAQLADGVVLVVRADRTEQAAVQEAVQLLAGANLYGAVVNRSKPALPAIVRRAFSA